MRDIHNTFLMDLKQITQIKPYGVFKEKIQAEQAGNVIGDITATEKENDRKEQLVIPHMLFYRIQKHKHIKEREEKPQMPGIFCQ